MPYNVPLQQTYLALATRKRGELRAVLATAHRDYTTRQPGEAITIIDLVGP